MPDEAQPWQRQSHTLPDAGLVNQSSRTFKYQRNHAAERQLEVHSFITRRAGRATASLASILPARKRVLLFIYSSAGSILVILEILILVVS